MDGPDYFYFYFFIFKNKSRNNLDRPFRDERPGWKQNHDNLNRRIPGAAAPSFLPGAAPSRPQHTRYTQPPPPHHSAFASRKATFSSVTRIRQRNRSPQSLGFARRDLALPAPNLRELRGFWRSGCVGLWASRQIHGAELGTASSVVDCDACWLVVSSEFSGRLVCGRWQRRWRWRILARLLSQAEAFNRRIGRLVNDLIQFCQGEAASAAYSWIC